VQQLECEIDLTKANLRAVHNKRREVDDEIEQLSNEIQRIARLHQAPVDGGIKQENADAPASALDEKSSAEVNGNDSTVLVEHRNNSQQTVTEQEPIRWLTAQEMRDLAKSPRTATSSESLPTSAKYAAIDE